jgi:putative ABC transport system permease protein
MASGTWLNDATAQYPAVVLGTRTAERLGVGAVKGDMQICLDGRWFAVIGILARFRSRPNSTLAR